MVSLASALLAACSNNGSNTKIMVAVWSDLVVPAELDSIHVDVNKGSSASSSTPFALTNGSDTKPIVVMELVSPDNKATTFEVVATGFLNGAAIVSQAASLSFDPGHSRLLTLFLARACRDANSGPCTQTITVVANSLPEYNPQGPFPPPDFDAGVADASSVETGGVDLVADAQQTVDAAADNLVADARQIADAAPDAGTETAADVPLVLDAAPDAPSDPRIANDTVEVPDSTSTCNPSTTVCTQPADGATDVAELDTRSNTPADAPASLDASPDKPFDLTTAVDTGQDVETVDTNSACVLPMTTCTGLCINPQTSVDNCGGCGRACGTQNGTPNCAAAVCSMSSCSPGFFDCSANENTSRDGCETNGNTDSANCGRCGNVCSSKVCRNETCLATARYGNTGAGSDLVDFSVGFLAGIQIYIPNASVVTGIGVVLYDLATPSNMYLGLYKDVAGNPGDLVATVSNPTLVAPGGKELSVAPPVDVLAGTYWILGVWDGLASFATNSTTNVTWRFSSYPFGPLPAAAPTSMDTVSAPPPNLYVIVAQ